MTAGEAGLRREASLPALGSRKPTDNCCRQSSWVCSGTGLPYIRGPRVESEPHLPPAISSRTRTGRVRVDEVC